LITGIAGLNVAWSMFACPGAQLEGGSANYAIAQGSRVQEAA